MRKVVWSVVVLQFLASGLQAAEAVSVSHTQFQAVDETGEQAYAQNDRVALEGIVLNNPADLLDPTADDTITTKGNLGGQWQIYVQGEGADHAGTAVFMGQLYDNVNIVYGRYSDAQFIAELTRLNAAQFSPGDRVRVTGLHKSFKGKNNINERHFAEPEYDFTIEIIAKGIGVPRPEVVSIEELTDTAGGFIFDPLRLAGSEYYQGRLVKIAGVRFVDPNLWRPNAEMRITDGARSFPVKLGRGNGIYQGSYNLTEPFDVVGIMDQESPDLKAGYRLWVPNYDGNGHVLAGLEHRLADLPINADPNAGTGPEDPL